MALPITIPYTFATATTSIPLSQLDADFSTIYATVNGIGNGTVALSNVAISGGNGTFTNITSPASTNLTIQSASTTALTIDTSQNVTAVGTLAMGSSFKRNRIINGNMLIDQRNAGASVTPTDGQYLTDRFVAGLTAASKFTAQQSSTAPTGFSNSLLITSSSAYSVSASDAFTVGQKIEGFNFADLMWGTASAATVTLSFWVRSSLTGTFGGAITNSAGDRSYPFSYTISAANTWEQKSVTIAGDTSGTWIGSTNGIGARVWFGLGVGTTYSGTAGAWVGSPKVSATGAVSVVGTSGATFYITGVQLEVGTKATPYEMQIYSDQLAQCQRYCYRPAINSAYSWLSSGGGFQSTTTGLAQGSFPVTMRAVPTSLVLDTATLSNYALYQGASFLTVTALSLNSVSTASNYSINCTVASGGAVGGFFSLATNNQTSYGLYFNAEL